jgi:hypothetical protein
MSESPAVDEKKEPTPKPSDDKNDGDGGRRRYSDPHVKTAFAAKLNFWQQVAVTKQVTTPAAGDHKHEEKTGGNASKRAGRSVPATSRRTSAANEVAAANATAKAALSTPTSPMTLQVPGQGGALPTVKDRMKQFSHPPTQEYISRAKATAPKAGKALQRLSQVQRAVEKGKPIAPDVLPSVDRVQPSPIPEDSSTEEKKNAEPSPGPEPSPSPGPEPSPGPQPEPSPVNQPEPSPATQPDVSGTVIDSSPPVESPIAAQRPEGQAPVQPKPAPEVEPEYKKPNLTIVVPLGESFRSNDFDPNASSPVPLSPSILSAAKKLEGIEEMVGHMYDSVEHHEEDEPKFSGTGKLAEMKISTNTVELTEGDMHKYDIKRNLVREEIISTEKTYIAGLKILIEKFAHPLKASDKYGVTQEQAARIFSNIEIISHFHDKLYEELQRPETFVGDVFSKYADFLKMYTQYLNGYETSMSVINTLSGSKQFKQFLESRRQDPEVTLDLMSYLILPVQRIPRYELLLREFLKNTPEGHTEREILVAAFEKVQKIAQYINESKRRVENMSKVLAIQNKIEGNMDVPLLAPHRRLIKEGHVEVCRTNLLGHNYRKRVIFLFNDSFLTTAEDFAFKDWVLIEGDTFSVHPVEEHGKHGFAVKHKDHDEKYFCISEAEREEWISLLHATREAYEEVVNAAKARQETRTSTTDAPSDKSRPIPSGPVRSPSMHNIKA